MGPHKLLPFKIHSNFSSSDEITKVFVISIISIVAPPKIFASPCATPDHLYKNICFALRYKAAERTP